ncbi:tRNA uracil 4-sulfurtransferase ThiI [Alkalibacillus haloalkaliphilus]|uniref:Probable tRNA sulfurtransferase n=1 Tax=Alkalibacillus haloalkaliphilus TaxID=94136 RepID=A0A511W491_9BACI|nr:tRNA uracil 4-sulfurtransferase ThiI [Alkalibacillus haloalkaliphilus]GEN45915.1 putative tRNA sulfurtransferase [Alkalibacillus haloalkaliphilus]
MKYDHILIRYGELALKGKNQKFFINTLRSNVQRALKDYPDLSIKGKRDHMYILLDGRDPDPIVDKCKDIFGIQSFSLAMKVVNDEEKIKEAALEALRLENGQTFKITCKRSNKDFPVRSQEMNQILGGHLLRNSEEWTVNVREPDVEIRVEIRHDATYITARNIPGKGGLPVGSTGKSLLLMSGGIDSPVAGYLTMKRGVKIEAIHFHSPPFTSERAKQKVEDLAQTLTKFGGEVKLHLVPFTEVQQKIFKEAPENYGMTIMRRLMLRISEQIAQKEEILSLTTGESLGQVASQTMESMHTINEVTNYPIIRPLVAMDKSDIIDISKEIETYEISIRPYEDCCTIFVPKQPKTRPKREKVNQFEAPIDFTDDIAKAVEGTETVMFSPSNPSQESEFDELL